MKITKARPMHKDYYEYRTMTIKKYEKMKKVKLFYDEWVAVEMGIEQVLLRRYKGWATITNGYTITMTRGGNTTMMYCVRI